MKGKENFMLGLVVDSSHLIDKNYSQNEETFLARLHEKDAFDFEAKFEENDRLEIVLMYPQVDDDFVNFTFSYQNGKWQPEEFDPFELENHYDVVTSGELKNIFAQE
ncbi:MAG: hypothetical protein IPN29_12410 [Saprospiraceae bacterium]|nr:hypothetical protein [Saprospiraceae bacterium]